MDFSQLPNSAILAEIGSRINRLRLNLNMTQSDLAQRAGVTRIVVQRLEQGLGCTLDSLVRLLRGLGALDQLDIFIPEPGMSPLQLAKLKGRERRRASRPRRADGDGGADGRAD